VDLIVRRVAARYARRCWWADRDDLAQSGWEAAILARGTFEPRVGVPEAGYVWRAVTFSMRRWLWKESSPVSGGMSDPWRLRVSRRADLDESLPCTTPTPEALLDELRWTERVRARALAVAEQDALALPVLLGEGTPREIASETGVPLRDVYAASARLRTSIVSDEALWLLSEETKT
jgi:DNA-directed RNA polymerase specialized sigma24 family protein